MNSRPYFLGGLFLLLGGWIGWMLANRRTGAAPYQERALMPARTTSLVVSFTVSASAVEIVGPSTRAFRRISIVTDQPVRIGRTSDLQSRPDLGVPVAAGNTAFEWGQVGPDERLFAVMAPNGSTANVSVLTQVET